MTKKMVRIEKRDCNLKMKKKTSDFVANKDAKCRKEDVSLKQSNSLQRSKECTTKLSTPTIIIDIAQKYSENSLLLSDEVRNIL